MHWKCLQFKFGELVQKDYTCNFKPSNSSLSLVSIRLSVGPKIGKEVQFQLISPWPLAAREG